MKKGCLIVNGYLKTLKFNEIYSMLSASFSKHNVFLEILNNIEAQHLIINKDKILYDFILFWDKDIYLCQMLEIIGYRVFNSSSAIEICDDKALTYLKLLGKGIEMPLTFMAPKTFTNIGYNDLSFVETFSDQLWYPLVIKENFGSFGQQVSLVNNHSQAIEVITNINNKPFIMQKFISSSFGKDVRIQVVGGKVIASVLRIAADNEFRANVTSGGKMYNYIPSVKQTEMALKACEIIGLDFAGVDILFGDNDQPILCEVNSNAQFKNLQDATGINSADFICEYILTQIY